MSPQAWVALIWLGAAVIVALGLWCRHLAVRVFKLEQRPEPFSMESTPHEGPGVYDRSWPEPEPEPDEQPRMRKVAYVHADDRGLTMVVCNKAFILFGTRPRLDASEEYRRLWEQIMGRPWIE